jgi:hypothetical protein
MKIVILIFICLINLSLYSQTKSCEPRLDSSRIIEITKRHRPISKRDNKYPSVSFDSQSCNWTATTITCMRLTKNRFKIWKKVTLVIEDGTGKVLSKKKEKYKVPDPE